VFQTIFGIPHLRGIAIPVNWSKHRFFVFLLAGAFALISSRQPVAAAEQLRFILVPGTASDISIGGGQVWAVD